MFYKGIKFGSNYKHRYNGPVNNALVDALHADYDAAYEIRNEKPIHRRMIDLAIEGFNQREIAEHIGVCTKTVSHTLRQPWAREKIIQKSAKTVQDQIKELLEAEVLPSLRKIKEVRDNPKSRGADVLAASEKFLERFMGKPQQNITINEKPVSELTDEELRVKVEEELRRGAEGPSHETSRDEIVTTSNGSSARSEKPEHVPGTDLPHLTTDEDFNEFK